jgi:hypothetical protein
MPMTMTLERTGQFAVTWTESNENQCGLHGTQILTYRVKITSDTSNLNTQGFIVDNDKIQHYFDTRYKNVKEFGSCEHLAMIACKDLRLLCTKDGAIVKAVDVEISGAPHSKLTCSWQWGQS